MDSGYSVNGNAVLRFQHERIVKSLFVQFLITLEDLGHRHEMALDKLEKNLPEEYKKYVELADYFTEEEYQLLRKRVLDRGNAAINELNILIDQFDISLK